MVTYKRNPGRTPDILRKSGPHQDKRDRETRRIDNAYEEYQRWLRDKRESDREKGHE